MSTLFLHEHQNFRDLLNIVSSQMKIDPILIEKDYWIMHCLYGLEKLGMKFYLKGGTSLSKGYKIINRFSEDIDILIEPPLDMNVYIGKNQDKLMHRDSRRLYYDWLAENIRINGISKVKRDHNFDDDKYRSGGIRLIYKTMLKYPSDLKTGILLEVGFDDIMPNMPKDISSWTYDYAEGKADIIDNRAKDVLCYHPGYTLVEKLQTISTKFRKQQENGLFSENFLRHYYDVYCLLQNRTVQNFIDSEAYNNHKEKRFRSGDNPDISQNEAFLLTNTDTRRAYEREYHLSKSLYYKEKPTFEDILHQINKYKTVL